MLVTKSAPRLMPKLSEAARHLVYPELVGSLFPLVYEKLRAVGVAFDPWQQGFGTIALGLDKAGKFASTIGGVVASIPRQVGKTFTIGHLIVGLCLLIPGLRVIWTSHHLVTTGNTFASMQGMVKKPKLFRFVEEIRLANGEQRITFKNGSVIMFGARSHGFGLGMDAIDVVVFDEAQRLTARGAEDLVPTTNQARNPYGALLFFIGTPPRPADDGDAFMSKRRQALDGGSKNMVYVEFSADADAELDDRSQWPKMNPSYPFRTPLESMLRMRENMADDAAWRREAMGIWDSDQDGSRAISEFEWAASGISEPPADGLRVFAVAFNIEGTALALAGGLRHDDGVHVELIDAADGDVAEGLGLLADWLAARWRSAAQIVLSGAAGAPVLAQLLRDRHVPDAVVKIANTQEYTTACSVMLDAVRASASAAKNGDALMFTHLASEGQLALDESVAISDKKMRGTSGAWGWSATTDDGDETPIEAVSLAYWLATTTRRKPYGEKKQRAVIL